jgi:hypothetical protein
VTLIAGCNSANFPVYFENTAREPIEIEVLRAADTTIDLSVKKILIFIKPGLLSELNIKGENGSFSEGFNFKELPTKEFYKMADQLSASPRFAIMEPSGTIKGPSDNNSYSWDEIDSICTKAGVDGCLFLGKQEVMIGVTGESRGEPEDEYRGRGYIMLLSTYEFYSPKGKITFSKQVKTGVGFQASLEDIHNDFQYVNGLESLMYDYALENGEKFAGWLVPVWERDTRNYFLKGNAELESVKPLIADEKWNEVYAIWKRNITNHSPAVAKHAMYNTIISYEMEGKLDSALMLTNEAYKRFKSEELVDYGLILEERIRETGLVNSQLGLSEKE